MYINATIIAHNHHTDIYSQTYIFIIYTHAATSAVSTSAVRGPRVVTSCAPPDLRRGDSGVSLGVRPFLDRHGTENRETYVEIL